MLKIVSVLPDFRRQINLPRLPKPLPHGRNIPRQNKDSQPLGEPCRVLLQNRCQLILLDTPGFVQPVYQNTLNRAFPVNQVQERRSQQNLEHLIHVQRPDILTRHLRSLLRKAAARPPLEQVCQIFPIVRNSAGQHIGQRLDHRLGTVQCVLPLFAKHCRRDAPVIMRIVRREGALPDPGIPVNYADALACLVIQPALYFFPQPCALNMKFL